jgi:hypothetical protein
MSENKKCRKYSIEYLKFGFIVSPTNEKLPLCLFCEKTFSNEAMKPSRIKEHLMKKNSDKSNKCIRPIQQHRAGKCCWLLSCFYVIKLHIFLNVFYHYKFWTAYEDFVLLYF